MHCDIVTKQEKIFTSSDVVKVIVPATLGQLTILPNHQNLICTLTVGEVIVVTNDKEHKVFIDQGLLQVSEEGVSILVDRGLPSADVIKKEIEKAVAKAEEKMNDANTIDEETLMQLERQLRFERFVKDRLD